MEPDHDHYPSRRIRRAAAKKLPREQRLLRRRLATLGASSAAITLASMMVPAVAHAATDQVTTTEDSGDGSLRQVIADASAGDEITFASNVTGTIDLSTPLTIDKALTITGPGAGLLTIDGGNETSLLDLTGYGADDGLVTISGLTFADGHTDFGAGAIYDIGRSLTLDHDVITSSYSGGGDGGIAIYDYSYDTGSVDISVVISNTTVSDNVGPRVGGIHADLHDGSSLTVSRSTISGSSGNGITFEGNAQLVPGHYEYTCDKGNVVHGNQCVYLAGYRGEGDYYCQDDNATLTDDECYIPATRGDSYIYGYDLSGAVTISNSTVTGTDQGNVAVRLSDVDNGSVIEQSTISGNAGDGIEISGGNAAYAPSIAATIVANNGSASCSYGAAYYLSDAGYNIDDDGSCGFQAELGSISDSSTIDANLGALADNGGPTQTIALTARSSDPAVGVISAGVRLPTGETACSVADQRGDARPAPCDIGAVNATNPSSGTGNPPPSTTPTAVVVTDHALAYGEDSTLTATVSGGAGTVQFSVDNQLLGSPVQVSGGTATSPALSTLASFPLAVGDHSVTAVYTPADSTMQSSADVKPLVVSKSATTTTVGVKPHALAALVSPTAPGSGTPTGTVAFSVGGKVVGTADLQGGVASLAYTMPAGSSAAVSAAYAGDGNFTASSGSTARRNPAITATVSSPHHKTRYGWYRSRVTVTFHCTRGSAPLASCPPPAILRHNGKGQSVRGTVHATDGGMATVSVTGLNIDKTKPKVHVTGVRPGSTHAHVVALGCAAHDGLSGIARCNEHDHRIGSVVHFTVTAVDKAGNRRTEHGHYSIG